MAWVVLPAGGSLWLCCVSIELSISLCLPSSHSITSLSWQTVPRSTSPSSLTWPRPAWWAASPAWWTPAPPPPSPGPGTAWRCGGWRPTPAQSWSCSRWGPGRPGWATTPARPPRRQTVRRPLCWSRVSQMYWAAPRWRVYYVWLS